MSSSFWARLRRGSQWFAVESAWSVGISLTALSHCSDSMLYVARCRPHRMELLLFLVACIRHPHEQSLHNIRIADAIDSDWPYAHISYGLLNGFSASTYLDPIPVFPTAPKADRSTVLRRAKPLTLR